MYLLFELRLEGVFEVIGWTLLQTVDVAVEVKQLLQEAFVAVGVAEALVLRVLVLLFHAEAADGVALGQDVVRHDVERLFHNDWTFELGVDDELPGQKHVLATLVVVVVRTGTGSAGCRLWCVFFTGLLRLFT